MRVTINAKMNTKKGTAPEIKYTYNTMGENDTLMDEIRLLEAIKDRLDEEIKWNRSKLVHGV